MSKIYDFHTHSRPTNDIFSVICSTNPCECARQKVYDNAIHIAGLHPWHADKFCVSDIEQYIKSSQIIGEIGMDNTWCKVPLNLQETVFIEQLNLAREQNKPVLIHSKGCEKKILEILQNFKDLQIIIHWYSCEDFLDDFIELGCFFTLGPDLQISKITQNIAKKLPLQKLFLESDGIDAVNWVFGTNHTQDYVKTLLIENAKFLASLKNLSTEQTLEALEQNVLRILKLPT